jgi:hypothetical protein
MFENPEDLIKAVPEDVIKAAYEDLASRPLSELSKLGTDAVKTVRLITAPLQITAGLQDRLSSFIQNRVSKIPQEKMQESPAMIIGPSIEKMKYLPDNSPLWEMFEELLLKSMNRDEIDKAHPSFVHIIGQLSHNEAILLYELSQEEFSVIDYMDYNRSTNKFSNRIIEKSTIPTDKMVYHENFELYYNHLNSMSLVNWPVEKQTPIKTGNIQTGLRRNSKWVLTDFGKLFIEACIPGNGFKSI